MDITGISIIAIVVITLLLQAVMPSRRVSIVMIGAVMSTFVNVFFGRATMETVYHGIHWNVLLILIGLGLFTSILARSNVFGIMAAKATRLTGGVGWLVLVIFSVIMFLVSALLNNITAICLMLPVYLLILQTLGVTQAYLGLFMALILTATNLGGAASPIGDFPAILLISDKDVSMTCGKYATSAGPVCTLILLLVIVAFVIIYNRFCRLRSTTLSRRVSLAVTRVLYRNVPIKWSILLPGSLIFAVMVILWAFAPAQWHLSPDLVCLSGVSGLIAVSLCIANPSHQENNSVPFVENIVRRETDIESALFLASLFSMVFAVETTGVLKLIGEHLAGLSAQPVICISALMVTTGLSTALFSAGPAMGAMLPIAKQVAPLYPEGTVYIGLALSVCAGSSFLLTAATSGPLTQTLVERFNLITNENQPARFGFWTFLPYGVLSFVIIQVCAIAWTLMQLYTGGVL